jgi:N6-L-threonylcarbamoyladenine synthase
MEIIGATLDDAAGEAFDKAAKIMGLPYPGGPAIDRLAKTGDPLRFIFPKPSIPDLNFSFSGLKTSFLYFLRDALKKDESFLQENLEDLCASIQHTIITILMDKLILASRVTGIREIGIAGGVSANSEMRKRLIHQGKELKWRVFIPEFEFTTDNAAMIAMAGYQKFLQGEFADQSVTPYARSNF